MPISPTSLSKLRSSMHVVRPVINYFPAEVVATGVVSSTVTTYPIGQISVTWDDAAYLNIRVGQLFIVRSSGGEVVTYGVARLTPNSTTLYIDGKARGDAGLAVSQAFGLTAGQIVTVYTYQPLWALLSRIKDGQFYKKFDIPYDGSGSNPSPVCNLGSWRQVWANTQTGYGRVTFDNANSFAWLSKTIVAYQWTIPIDAVIVSGGLTTSSITLDLPQGFHIVRCQITDSGSAVQRSFRPIWVNGDDFPPLSDVVGHEISSDTQDRTGRNITLNINGDFSSENNGIFLPGGAFLFTEESSFNGQPMEAGVLVDNYVGFANTTSRVNDLVGGNKATTFDTASPFTWMGIIPMVSQAIVETASPANWTDIAMGLGTPNFMVWYILKHHTSYMDMFDYYPLTETSPPRKLNWGLNGSTVTEYLNQTASVFGGNIGCSSDGSLYLRRDPNVETVAFRNTVDERMTIKIDPTNSICDVISPPEIPTSFFNSVGQIRLYALVYDGSTTTAYGSIAPGYVQMQAASSQDEDSFIIKPVTDSLFVGGQDGVNFTSGHLLARTNAPIKQISLALNRNMDVVDPAKMFWFNLSIPATWSPTQKAIALRGLPVSVDRGWEAADGGGWVKNITMNFSPETFGQPGETLLMDQGAASNYDPLEPPVQQEEEALQGLGFLGAINFNGHLGRTFNAETWNNIQGNMIGQPQDLTLDYYSPYVQSGFAEGNLGAWVIVARETTSGSGVFNTADIWYTENLLATTITYVQQATFAGVGDMRNSLRIISNVNTEGLVAACVKDMNGTRVFRTEDRFNWFSDDVGDITTGGAAGAEGQPCDIAFQGNSMVITSGFKISSGKWVLAYSAVPANPFTLAVSSPEGDVPYPMIDTTDSFVYATKVINKTSSLRTNFSMYVEDVAGTPTVKKRKRVYTSYPSTFTDTFDPDEVTMTIKGTPNNTPRLLTLYSSVNPAQIYGYCTIGAGPSITKNGWLLKDAGYTAVGVKAEMNIELKGSGTLLTAKYTTDTISKYPDPTTWGSSGAIGRFITNTMIMYDKDGVLLTGCQVINNRIADASYCDTASLDWSSVDCFANTVFDTSRVEMTMEYPSTPSATNVPPDIVTLMSADFQDYEVQVPKLYRIPNIAAGSPVYTDITPMVDDEAFVPMNPYALSADVMNAGKINAILRGGGGRSRLGTSLDSGATWQIFPNAGYYYGLKEIDMFGLLWGTNTILYTEDDFDTTTELFDGWVGSIDSGGVIKVVKAAF